MSKPEEDIEDILARLMPVALSERAGTEIQETIDQLAQDSGMDIPSIRPSTVRWRWVAGVAASVVFATLVLWKQYPATPSSAALRPVRKAAELVHISHTDTLQSVVREGWHEDIGGNPHQALRLHMLAQQQIRDEQTGIVMTVTQPREEVLLVPVHAF